ncbi:MAG: putative leader peptide [Jatrophihabitans sp.]
MSHGWYERCRPVWDHRPVRPVSPLFTSRRHIDLVRVAGAGC